LIYTVYSSNLGSIVQNFFFGKQGGGRGRGTGTVLLFDSR